MIDELTRRGFLGLLPAGTLAFASGLVPARAEETVAVKAALHAEFPRLDPLLVREVVGASHTRIKRVAELVEASPALARAAWDWGFGDWESALGAASHMGRRDIAELLIEHGARPDLFTHAMLGHLDVVRAAVKSHPGVQTIHGPHGITLLRHAKAGGEPAAAVAAYLESLGDADRGATSLEISDKEQELYLGRYSWGPGDDDALVVTTNSRGRLSIRRGDDFGRVLNRVETHAFAPGGAPDVRVRFRIEGGKAIALTVHDPHPLVTARRVNP